MFMFFLFLFLEWSGGPKVCRRNMRSFVRRMHGEVCMKGVLPANLIQLTFGFDFNQPLAVGVLPANLTQLTFGELFNQPLAVGVLPANLTQLIFGEGFDQFLAGGVLPAGLTHLIFGGGFNQPLAVGVLPGLTKLTFGPGRRVACEPDPTIFWSLVQLALGRGRAACQPDLLDLW